jgi:hypothetical protein
MNIPNKAMPGYSCLAFLSARENQNKSLPELEILQKVAKND